MENRAHGWGRNALWRGEVRRIGAVCAPCLVIGLLAGKPLASLCVALIILLAFHLLQLHRLSRWLDDRNGYPSPTRSGYWGRISDALYGLQRRNRKRRKRVRKVLKRFRQAAEALPEAAVILDAEFCITSINPSAEYLLGLRKGVDYGQPVHNLMRAPAFAEYLRAGNFDRPLKIGSPLGHDKLLQVSVVPYGGNQSLLLARDVTRLARLEQMRSDLVANVSHELRTPLTVMVGNIEALEDTAGLDENATYAIGQVRNQSRRMWAIVDDLLRLSRLESDPADVELEPVPLGPLLSEVRTNLLDLESTECDVVLEVPPDVALMGAQSELFSAVSNLAYNAARYTGRDGTVTLRVAVIDQEADGNDAESRAGGLRLSVIDTGVGIEAHHLPRLTERFYRVDQSRARQAGGTGLGLAIVKHVLMRHDARLRIESRPGEGSAFHCDFPPDRTVPAVANVAAEAEPAAVPVATNAALEVAPEAATDLPLEQAHPPPSSRGAHAA